jgi:hypothetical protein
LVVAGSRVVPDLEENRGKMFVRGIAEAAMG